MKLSTTKHPIHIPYVHDESRVKNVDATLQAREEAISMLKFHLNRAHYKMQSQVNKLRTDRQFEVGNWVYLKLQPHRQVSVRQSQQYKLSSKYYGPFMIEERIGTAIIKSESNSSSVSHLTTYEMPWKREAYGKFASVKRGWTLGIKTFDHFG